MRVYFLFAILGLLIVEAFLLPRTINDFKILRKMRLETAPEEAQPAAIGPFAGYGADGRPLALVHDDTKWIVPLVLHSGRFANDLDYLGRLRKALANSTIVIMGVCDNSPCVNRIQPDAAVPDFPVVAYGSYAALVQIARYDDRSQVLLLNQFWGVRKPLRRAPSPEEMAAEIQEVIGK